MVRKWSEEEKTELIKAIDISVEQHAAKVFEVAEIAIEHFQSISSDTTCPFTKVQIVNKILSFVKQLGIKTGSDLLRDWKALRGELVHKAGGEGDTGSTRNGGTASKTLKLKIKRQNRKKSQTTQDTESEQEMGGSISELSISASDELSSPRSDCTLSLNRDTADQKPPTMSSRRPAVEGRTESADQSIHGDASAVADTFDNREPPGSILIALDPAEHSLIECTRRFFGHGHWQANPSDEDVDHTLEKILQKMCVAIQAFLKAIPTVGLAVSQLTAEARQLSSQLFNPAIGNSADLDRLLTILFTDPAVTIDLFLQIYAAVAVYEWVFQRFEGEVNDEERVVHRTLSQHAPEFARRLAICDKMDHLERNVKPRLPRLAEGFQVKLLDIFLSLRVAPQAPRGVRAEEAAELSTEDRARHLSRWQLKANQAFEQALDLRFIMEESQCPYSFRWAVLGQGFDRGWMESAHDGEEPPAQGSRVLVSLRPAIYSCSRMEGSEPLLIVSALVMLEGFGAPSELKIGFGSVR